MNTEHSIKLERYHSGYYEQLKDFKLPEEQEKFTALPVEMLEVTPERHPIVILSNDEPVGFFCITFKRSSKRVYR